MIFSGTDSSGRRTFGVVEILMGGIPGRPAGDGMDGHSWYPQLENTPCEYQEIYYPLVTEEAGIVPDSGGAGYHRGGCGVRKVFRFLAAGHVSIYDDRHTSSPWGIGGGPAAGARASGSPAPTGRSPNCPGKIDFVEVAPGDRLVFETAGAGGWGDPLLRPAEAVRVDVEKGFVSGEAAERSTAWFSSPRTATSTSTRTQRQSSARVRRSATRPLFDLGPRPASYQATVENPEIPPLGPKQAIEPQADRRRACSTRASDSGSWLRCSA